MARDGKALTGLPARYFGEEKAPNGRLEQLLQPPFYLEILTLFFGIFGLSYEKNEYYIVVSEISIPKHSLGYLRDCKLLFP